MLQKWYRDHVKKHVPGDYEGSGNSFARKCLDVIEPPMDKSEKVKFQKQFAETFDIKEEEKETNYPSKFRFVVV